MMYTEYRIVTNGEDFKVQIRKERLEIYEDKKKTKELKSIVWEDLGFSQGGLALGLDSWGLSLKTRFDVEEAAEKAAERAWGMNRLRHREWRVV